MVKKATNEPAVVTAQPDKKEKKAAPANQKQAGGLLRYTLITVIACVLAIALGSFAVKTLVIDAGNQAHGNKLAGTYARQYAGYFNQIFLQASRQLAGITASRQVIAVMASADPQARTQLSETLAASLAGQSQVYMVPNDMPPADVPLGLAARNMVERARAGEEIKAEIIPLQERPLLLLASAIRENQQVIGVLLVGFDLKEIATNLNVFNAETGYMTLLQYIPETGESKVAIFRGPAEFESSQYHETVDTIHPNIRVTYFLNPSLANSDSGQLFLIAMATTMLLVIIVIFAASALQTRSLRRNASMLLQYAESLLRRSQRPAGIQFDINLFDDVATSLSRTAAMLPTAPVGGAAVISSATRRARGEVDTEITPEDASHLSSGSHDAPASLSPEIFRAYDIRGVVGQTLTEETVRLLGRAIGSENLEKGQQAIYVGRDGRLSGPQLSAALIEGLTSTGCRVIDVGVVPTPLVYFACANGNVKSGVVLTGSHNPADHNGLKIVINGETLADARIQALKDRIINNQFRSGKGSAESADVIGKYRARVKDDVVLARPMKIVVDCGNGVAGTVAPDLLSSIGCEIIPLYCDVDGNFPNHHPDPSKPENLKDLIAAVAANKADLGIAFDGDGDRLGVVTQKGRIIFPDKLMMLFARDLLMRSPGADIIFDVKCSRDLADVISQNGGRPLMWRTGHSLIKAKLKETGAALAGEMSGHIFFNDRWFGFDDAIYSAARLLEILSLEVAPADEVFAEFPNAMSTPELQVKVSETDKFRIVEQLQKQGNFGDGSISTIDGVRVDYSDSWGLIRASNTTATLVFRFEGRSEQALKSVRARFQEQLQKVAPGLTIP